MATVAELLVKIGADTSDLRKELNAAKRQLKTAFGAEGMELSSKALKGIAALGAALAGLGVYAVKTGGELQNVQVAMTNLLGSAGKAESFIKELQENATVEPVFFEKIGEKSEPVKIKFFTPERYAKIGLAAFLMLLLPCCVAILIVLLNVFISNGSISELSKINYRYGGAWWALFVPICYILWIAVIRRDIYDYPVLYKILEDGSLERVKNLYPVRWKEILSLCFTSPLCWVALFILVLLVGSTGAMLM